MSDFRLRGELRLKNARLVEWRERLGMNQRQFAEHLGMSFVTYNGIETMRDYPSQRYRALLAAECECDEAALFPPELIEYATGRVSRTIVSTVVVDAARLIGSVRREVLALPAGDASDQRVVEDLDKGAILRALDTLKPRERRVLEMCYGLDGADPQTLEEIGAVLNVNRERARQIREKALSRLRERRVVSHLPEVESVDYRVLQDRSNAWDGVEQKRRRVGVDSVFRRMRAANPDATLGDMLAGKGVPD